jgi:hypothetical protein
MDEGEVGGTFGAHGGRERCLQVFNWGGLKVRDLRKDLDVSERIILRWT